MEKSRVVSFGCVSLMSHIGCVCLMFAVYNPCLQLQMLDSFLVVL